jgi:hypothetical protein
VGADELQDPQATDDHLYRAAVVVLVWFQVGQGACGEPGGGVQNLPGQPGQERLELVVGLAGGERR